MKPAARARQAQQQAIAQDLAYKRVRAVCDAVEARIEAHGADGLPEYCARFSGEGFTVCSAILGIVLRRLGRDARDVVRDVLPC